MISEEVWNTWICKGLNNVEFDWFGVDQNGYLGVFSTFNQGYIPKTVLSSRLAYLELLIEIEHLPFIYKPILMTKSEGIFIDWLEYAQQGLIGFDYQDVHRSEKKKTYDLISLPETLPKVDDLGIQNSLIELIPKFRLDFNQPEGIDEEELKNKIV